MIVRPQTRRHTWLLALALAASTGLTLPHARVAQAQGLPAAQRRFTQYVNRKAAYTISYPASWQHIPDSGSDLFVGAPDHSAFLTVSTSGIDSRVTAAAITAQQKKVLSANHLVAGTLTVDTKTIGGVTFQVTEGVTTQGKKLVDMLILDTVRHGTLYDINAGIVLKVHSTTAETRLLLTSLNSISIH